MLGLSRNPFCQAPHSVLTCFFSHNSNIKKTNIKLFSRYTAYGSDVVYSSTSYYGTGVNPNMQYADISADYVDSTTAYDPRPNIESLTADSGIMTSMVTTG